MSNLWDFECQFCWLDCIQCEDLIGKLTINRLIIRIRIEQYFIAVLLSLKNLVKFPLRLYLSEAFSD
jgi:hypothetical protein